MLHGHLRRLPCLLAALALWQAPAHAIGTESQTIPTISTSAYTAGYVLGGIESFVVPNGGIQSVISSFKTGAYVGGVDWLVFKSSPTGGGTTDHAALALVATDMAKLIGVIHASDCKLTATVTSYCQSGNSPQMSRAAVGATVYVVKQVIGAPTFTAATDDIDTMNGLP